MLVCNSDSGQTSKKSLLLVSYLSHLNLLIKNIISNYKTQKVLGVLQCQHPTLDSKSLAELTP